MKRLLLILLLLFAISGCENTSNDLHDQDDPKDSPVVDPCNVDPSLEECQSINPIDPPVEDPPVEDTYTISTYASDIEFTITKADVTSVNSEEYFATDISSVSYSPIEEEVCVNLTVTDPDFANATYFMILQDTDRYLTRQQIQLGSGGSVFSNGGCMDITDPTLDYQILIGKMDRDSYSYDPSYLEASVRVRFSDLHRSERKVVSITQYDNLTPDVITEIGSAFIKTRLNILDEQSAITHVIVQIESPQGKNIVVKELIAEDITSGSVLTILEEIHDLAPRGEYKLTVYISGNDGYDDFSEIKLFSDNIEAAATDRWQYLNDNVLDIYHDLYAYVYDFEATEDEIIFHYYYKNNLVMLDGEQNPLELTLVLFDETDTFYNSYDLVEGENSISVPKSELSEEFSFEIQDLKTSNLYDYAGLPSFEPRISTFTDADSIMIKLIRDYGNITNVNVKVYASGYAAVIEEINLEDVYSNPYFSIYHDFGDINYKLIVTVEYEAYDEINTYTLFK